MDRGEEEEGGWDKMLLSKKRQRQKKGEGRKRLKHCLEKELACIL